MLARRGGQLVRDASAWGMVTRVQYIQSIYTIPWCPNLAYDVGLQACIETSDPIILDVTGPADKGQHSKPRPLIQPVSRMTIPFFSQYAAECMGSIHQGRCQIAGLGDGTEERSTR